MDVLLVIHSHGKLVDLLHRNDKVLHMFRYIRHDGWLESSCKVSYWGEKLS